MVEKISRWFLRGVCVTAGVFFIWGLVDMALGPSGYTTALNGRIGLPFMGTFPAFFAGTMITLCLVVGVVCMLVDGVGWAVARICIFLHTGSVRRIA